MKQKSFDDFINNILQEEFIEMKERYINTATVVMANNGVLKNVVRVEDEIHSIWPEADMKQDGAVFLVGGMVRQGNDIIPIKGMQ